VNKPADGVGSPIDFAGYRHKTDKSPALWVIEQLNESALKLLRLHTINRRKI